MNSTHPTEGSGYVGVLDAASGDLRGRFVTDVEPHSLSASGDSFYVVTREGDRGGMLYAGSVDSQDEQWNHDLGDPDPFGHLVVDDDNVYVATEANAVHAVGRDSGEEVWTHDDVTSPTVEFATADTVVVADEGEVVGLDPGSGSVNTTLDIPDENPEDLAVANGRLFFRGDEYVVHAVDD